MLSKKQIDFYHENGYLGVEGVLTADEVAELRRVTDGFVQLSASVTEHTDVFDLEPGHTSESPKLRRLKDPVTQHEVFKKCLKHPAYPGYCRAARRTWCAYEWQQTEYEVTGVRQPCGVASGLGVLSAYE